MSICQYAAYAGAKRPFLQKCQAIFWHSIIRLPQVSSKIAALTLPIAVGVDLNATPFALSLLYSLSMSSTKSIVAGMPAL